MNLDAQRLLTFALIHGKARFDEIARTVSSIPIPAMIILVSGGRRNSVMHPPVARTEFSSQEKST